MKFSAESGLWVGFLDYLRGLDSPHSGNEPGLAIGEHGGDIASMQEIKRRNGLVTWDVYSPSLLFKSY